MTKNKLQNNWLRDLIPDSYGRTRSGDGGTEVNESDKDRWIEMLREALIDETVHKVRLIGEVEGLQRRIDSLESFTEDDVKRCEEAMVMADIDCDADDMTFNRACVCAVLTAFTHPQEPTK